MKNGAKKNGYRFAVGTIATSLMVVLGLAVSGHATATGTPSTGEYGTDSATTSKSMVDPAVWAAQNKKVASASAAETTTWVATEVTYNPKTNKVLSRHRYVHGTTSSRRGDLSGGTSTPSGCKRVTITYIRHNALGSVAWKFHVWTDWCWTRSNQVVSVNGRDWYISDVDSQHQWAGIVQGNGYYYDFSADDGHPRSAFYHYKMGSFTNCVFKYGCISTAYPANTVRSYYNGTWIGKTEG